VLSEEGAAVTSGCPITLDSLYNSQSFCSGSKSSCRICGPATVNVPVGGSVTYQLSLDCNYNSYRISQRWSTPWHVRATSTSSSFGSVVSWTVTAQGDAIVGQQGETKTEWCLGGSARGYVGFKTKVVVVGPTHTTLPPVTTTTPITNVCPQGYTMQSSSYSHSPRDPSWCSGTSSCKVCKSLGSWQNGVRTVKLALACTPLTQSPTANRYWYQPYHTDVSATWLPMNAGSTWTLKITGTGQRVGDKFNLTNEWCLRQAGIQGYAAINVAIPLP